MYVCAASEVFIGSNPSFVFHPKVSPSCSVLTKKISSLVILLT